MQPRHEDWGALIERTANGEEGALAALYDGTAALVNGLALRILGDRGAAEEVTGDVYLQVWRQAEHCYVLDGDFHLADRGSTHEESTTDRGCLLLIIETPA